MLALLDPAVALAHRVVHGLSSVFFPLVGDAAPLVGLVLLTLLVRLCLVPLGYAASQNAQARAALAPRLRDLRDRYKRDPVRLHEETNALLRSHGISPYGGLLPTLVQIPLFALMYRLCTAPAIGGHVNVLLTHTVAGVPLGHSLVAGGLAPGALLPVVVVYLGLYLLLGVIAWWSSRLTRRTLAADVPSTVARIAPVLPYSTLLFAAFVPLAAAVYVTVSTAWTTMERAVFTADAAGAR
ncbi:MAG TPA: membrane protein insertase YidC [Actinopolymorphaceae bacterium]|jgi:YidC/Oxa1 family membrane protein insertase